MTPTIQGCIARHLPRPVHKGNSALTRPSSASEDPSDTFRADAAAQWQHAGVVGNGHAPHVADRPE